MKKLVIYYTADKKSFQVVHPTEKFAGDWTGLVEAITGGVYHRYEII